MSNPNLILDAALEYARRGWHVFPVYGIRDERCTCCAEDCAHPGKHPGIKRWETLATTEPEKIREWFDRWPNANIGWALGRDGFAAVDIDPRNGGSDSFAHLERALGPLDTVRQLTGGGGVHHICRLPTDADLRPRNDAFGESYPGIDLKTTGGLIVLAPSMHISGKRYTWDANSPGEFIELPRAWIEAVRSTRVTDNGTLFELPPRVQNGERHRILHRLACSLRDKGANGPEMLAMLHKVNEQRCNPPVSVAELNELARDTEQRYRPKHSILTLPRKEELVTVKWGIESAAEIARRGVPPAVWDIEELLPQQDGPAIMFGPPGSLKSWIALHAAVSVATGNPFLGHFAVRRRRHALYINLDAGARAFERRVIRSGLPIENLLIVSPDEFNMAALRRAFEAYPEAFVVIDTMADAFRTSRADDPAEVMRGFLRALRALFQEYGANGLILDHPHRPREGAPQGDYYGSIQKEATARIMWQVAPLPHGEDGVSRAKIGCRKMSEGEPFAPLVARLDFNDKFVVATYDGKVAEPGPGIPISSLQTDAEIVAQVLRSVPGGVSRAALQNRTGLSRDRVLAAVAAPPVAAIGNGPARRYILSESYVKGDDLPDNPESGANNLSEPSGSLGEPTNPNDSDALFESGESCGPPNDSADDSADFGGIENDTAVRA